MEGELWGQLPSIGAVIVIVLAFLRFLRDERESNIKERQSQRETFTGQCAASQAKVVGAQEKLESAIDRNTGIMDQVRGVLLKLDGGG